MKSFVMIRIQYPRRREGIGELPLWEDKISSMRVFIPLGNDYFYKVFDGSRLVFLVETGVHYDFSGLEEDFTFEYLHNSAVRKQIIVKKGLSVVERLDVDYLLTKYGKRSVVNFGCVTRNDDGVQKKIRYSNGNYYIEKDLVAEESLGGGLFSWFYELWKEKRFVPYDEFIRIEFDESLLKREEAVLLLVARYAGLRTI